MDLALFTVKTYQNQQAIPAMLPMIGPNTTVLCLQNGIDSYQTVAGVVGLEKVLPGAAYIEASILEPGVVKQTGSVVRIAFGEPDGSDSQRGTAILEALTQAQVPAQFEHDIQKTLWSKFLFIATMAGVTTLALKTMAELMPVPEWRQIIVGCMKEIEAVARSTGVNLDAGLCKTRLNTLRGRWTRCTLRCTPMSWPADPWS